MPTFFLRKPALLLALLLPTQLVWAGETLSKKCAKQLREFANKPALAAFLPSADGLLLLEERHFGPAVQAHMAEHGFARVDQYLRFLYERVCHRLSPDMPIDWSGWDDLPWKKTDHFQLPTNRATQLRTYWGLNRIVQFAGPVYVHAMMDATTPDGWLALFHQLDEVALGTLDRSRSVRFAKAIHSETGYIPPLIVALRNADFARAAIRAKGNQQRNLLMALAAHAVPPAVRAQVQGVISSQSWPQPYRLLAPLNAVRFFSIENSLLAILDAKGLALELLRQPEQLFAALGFPDAVRLLAAQPEIIALAESLPETVSTRRQAFHATENELRAALRRFARYADIGKMPVRGRSEMHRTMVRLAEVTVPKERIADTILAIDAQLWRPTDKWTNLGSDRVHRAFEGAMLAILKALQLPSETLLDFEALIEQFQLPPAIDGATAKAIEESRLASGFIRNSGTSIVDELLKETDLAVLVEAMIERSKLGEAREKQMLRYAERISWAATAGYLVCYGSRPQLARLYDVLGKLLEMKGRDRTELLVVRTPAEWNAFFDEFAASGSATTDAE